jgi:hypothetical protein
MKIAAQTADFSVANAVPAGQMVELIVFVNSVNNTASLSCGSTSGGSECFTSEGIRANGITTIAVNKTFSMTAATTLYIHHANTDDNWNAITTDVYIILRKIQ